MPGPRSALWITAPALLAVAVVLAVLLSPSVRRDRALEIRSPEAVLDRALLLGRTGRTEEAATLLRRAVDRYPDSAELHFRLGYLLRYAGLFEASIGAYLRGLELDDSPDARVNAEGQIAKSLVYLGDFTGALGIQEGLHDRLAAAGRAADEKMLFYEGVMNLYAGNRDRAVERFDAALATDSASLWSGFGLAYRHAAVGDSARLSALAREMVTRDVADGERHYRLVHFHALAGEPAEAVARLRVAIAAGFFPWPYLQEDPLTRSLQGTPGFDAALAQARARHEAFRAGW